MQDRRFKPAAAAAIQPVIAARRMEGEAAKDKYSLEKVSAGPLLVKWRKDGQWEEAIGHGVSVSPINRPASNFFPLNRTILQHTTIFMMAHTRRLSTNSDLVTRTRVQSILVRRTLGYTIITDKRTGKTRFQRKAGIGGRTKVKLIKLTVDKSEIVKNIVNRHYQIYLDETENSDRVKIW